MLKTLKPTQLGILYMLLSTLAFAFMNTGVKYMSDYNAYELVFFRSITTLCITSCMIWNKKISFLGNKRKLLIIRGLSGVISLILFFEVLKIMTVGTAVTLRYTSPIFAALIGLYFLKEKVRWLQWLFFGIALFGVLLLRGFDNSVTIVGLIMVLVSAALIGVGFVAIAKIGKQDDPLVIVNYFMFMGVVIGGLFMIKEWKTPTGTDWVILLSLGLFGFIGQLFMTKAFQEAGNSIIAPLKYTEVVFTLGVGLFVFVDVYSIWTVVGIFIIISALIGNVIYSSKIKLKEKLLEKIS